MESIIKPLPEAVHSAVRSGFIISDLTSVVEELLYNSLDAVATKVSVYVGANNGYVKVEDDGSGISRDGLVLLGERYATSKLHTQDKDGVSGSFGFRGEVLCSIADISLVEIVTKVHGRPNGYRKVMKGRKCLYLSIDNDRQDVGTTVIVRDLFYNQPVRRRQMQSSSKKILHLVKKCAVQIALMQPRVSFKVVDVESEDELFRTHASSSPLSVLCTIFGIEASSLHEVSFSEGSLMLTGYVSCPSTSSPSKAIQYIYVNSRFVVKGPIHKTLNRLADLCLGQLTGDKGGKRGQPNTGATYCLNLTCPRSSYDLNLEFSRTSVEFKDWAPVLTFIEKSVASLWCNKTMKGSYHCEAEQTTNSCEEIQKDWLLKTCDISAKRRRVGSTKCEQSSAINSSRSVQLQVEDDTGLSLWQDVGRQRNYSLRHIAAPGELESKRAFLNQIEPSDLAFRNSTSCSSDYAGVEKGIFKFSPHGHSIDDISLARYDGFSVETCSPSMERRGEYRCFPSVCWSPSVIFNGDVTWDVQRCQALEAEHIAGERLGRDYNWRSPDGLLSGRHDDILADEAFSPYLDCKNKLCTRDVSSISVHESPKIDLQRCQIPDPNSSFPEHSGRSYMKPRRSHSAPPTYRGKRRFLSMKNDFLFTAESFGEQTNPQVCNMIERDQLEHPPGMPLTCDENFQHGDASCTEESLSCADQNVQETSNITSVGTCNWNPGYLKQFKDSESSRIKWRDGCEDMGVEDIIKQKHAADERIRLEEMRQQVLSGEMKSITYLEEEKELVLPEMAYQLLCNYAEHIQQWGWMCNIFSQDSRSFAKNLNLLNAKPTHLTLLTVPCILGVNLSDADLLEYLEQLSDTDGSSTIPPSVLRILNYKACRGAIMFGDKLLPSECSLIVEELKRTSLCFQCAHGRPTTVPLVNLEALRKGISQLQSWHEEPKDSWHGLRRGEINLRRAENRLNMAKGGT